MSGWGTFKFSEILCNRAHGLFTSNYFCIDRAPHGFVYYLTNYWGCEVLDANDRWSFCFPYPLPSKFGYSLAKFALYSGVIVLGLMNLLLLFVIFLMRTSPFLVLFSLSGFWNEMKYHIFLYKKNKKNKLPHVDTISSLYCLYTVKFFSKFLDSYAKWRRNGSRKLEGIKKYTTCILQRYIRGIINDSFWVTVNVLRLNHVLAKLQRSVNFVINEFGTRTYWLRIWNFNIQAIVYLVKHSSIPGHQPRISDACTVDDPCFRCQYIWEGSLCTMILVRLRWK